MNVSVVSIKKRIHFFLGYVTQITLAVSFGVIIAQKVSSNF